MSDKSPDRRGFLRRTLAGAATLALAGCDRLSQTEWFPRVLGTAEKLNEGVQGVVAPRIAMAQEFDASALSPQFRSNGTARPAGPEYEAFAKDGFASYRLRVDGLVNHELVLTLAAVRELPSRTQITRHDCVEGWSAIGKWTGVRLSALLEAVGPRPEARYVVFHCADAMDEDGTRYYESIDLDEARHPQTILAYALNDAPLPVANGAPLRLRVERQLGYKMAKYIMRIELAARLDPFGKGKGGYWEDQGYEWYAGI